MGRLLEGHIIWLSDDRDEKRPVPKTLFEEYLQKNNETVLDGESVPDGENALGGESTLGSEKELDGETEGQ